MIIKKLTMKNFGVYAGMNTFEFSHSKPIVLIGGMNGRGKTTFLEAILLSLYGSNSAAYKESNHKTYGKYLRSYVNKNSWDQTAFVEIEFVMNESSQNEYIVRREWDALGKRTEETITVYENGEYSDFLTKNWTMFIENILPSALSRFFFFDGEKIAELAVDEANVQLKDSIRSMLGISVLDVLKNDLSRVLKRLAKDGKQATATSEIETLRQKRDELNASINEVDAQIERLISQIESQRATIDELHHQYEVKGGDVIEQRNGLMQQRADILAEIDQTQSSLIDASSGSLPLVMVQGLISDIKLQAEDEHNDQIMQQAIGMIDELLEVYAADHTESVPANKAFVEFVRKTTLEDATEPIYRISDHALFQLNALLDSILEQSLENVKALLERKTALKKKLDEVESYLSLDINEKALENVFALIRERESELVQYEVELSSLQQDRSSLNAALISATSEYSRAVETYLQKAELFDDEERLTKYSNMALRIAEEYTIALQKRKTGILGTTITECYKKLANKKNLIQTITMDPRTLDLTYLDDLGDVVDKDSLSAGEKQLMVIAILWALAICSKKKLPVIIDTPLSRLDSMHRTSLVTTYFPNASDQTIILSTDSEIDHSYYDLMKQSVGDEFTLSYDENAKSTTILKGYFLSDDN